MKKNLRYTIVALVILALLLATFPAAAGATQTEVNGTWEFIGEPSDEGDLDAWGMNVGRDLPWGYTTDIQCRKDTQFFEVITNSPLDGFASGEVNCFWHFDINFNLLGIHVWGTGTIYQNPDFTDPIWNCTWTGRIDKQGNFIEPMVCHGVGGNQGLLAKINLGNSYYDEVKERDIYPVTGYILDPGK